MDAKDMIELERQVREDMGRSELHTDLSVQEIMLLIMLHNIRYSLEGIDGKLTGLERAINNEGDADASS